MYEINEHIKIEVCRSESGFDSASDSAYAEACLKFGLNDCGYFEQVKDWNRSKGRIVVEFENYRHTGSMAGQTHEYNFVAWIEQDEE